MIKNKKATEICNECGKSVALGSRNFINRIPDFNGESYRRKEIHKPFPQGDYMCAVCEIRIREKKYHETYRN